MTRRDSEDQLLIDIATAIKALQERIRWKPGKDIQHLRTRQEYGHLPASATLADYEALIAGILDDVEADVYVYVWQSEAIFPTVVGSHGDRRWLVMFGLDGVMETAFPPTDLASYLSDPRFQYLGTMQEFVT